MLFVIAAALIVAVPLSVIAVTLGQITSALRDLRRDRAMVVNVSSPDNPARTAHEIARQRRFAGGN